MNPEVSIILPIHNGEKFLRNAILSVQNQTYKNWELIVINDESTDNSENIIEEFRISDHRIKVFQRPKSGIAKSLNFGLKKAIGQFIARIDSDDLWLPAKLEFQIRHFQSNKNLYLLGTSVELIDEEGLLLTRQKSFNALKFLSGREIKLKLLRNNLFCHSSVVFRIEMVNLIGYYDENFKNSEDYEYWIRAAKSVNCEITNKILVQYRIWPQALSFQKREEQIYYSLKARMKGLLSLGCIPLNFFYMAKFLISSLIYLFMKNFRRFYTIRAGN